MSRGRPKNFCREDVLNKALPVFWENGFSSTSLQLLEQATGVNKSGLYSEFQNKDDLYVECVRHYLSVRGGPGVLNAQPLGWNNIENFMRLAYYAEGDQKGCFTVSSVRDLANIPRAACELLEGCFETMSAGILQNVQAETTKMDAKQIAEMIRIYFFGFCMELTMDTKKAVVDRKIKAFMKIVKSL